MGAGKIKSASPRACFVAEIILSALGAFTTIAPAPHQE